MNIWALSRYWLKNVSKIIVTGNRLTFGGKTYRCAIGKGGSSADKKEGDGCTPIGIFPLRACWYRADRMPAPVTALSLKAIQENDGWCDDPKSKDYNRHVNLPFALSHETLFRTDHVYDLIIPLGYNDDPVIAGKGSAIFMHIVRAGYEPTQGCVALAKADLLEVLKQCAPETRIEIKQG